MKHLKIAGRSLGFFFALCLGVVAGIFVWLNDKLAYAEKSPQGDISDSKGEALTEGWVQLALQNEEYEYKYSQDEIAKLSEEFAASFVMNHLKKEKRQLILKHYAAKLQKGFVEFPGKPKGFGRAFFLSKGAQEIILKAFIRSTNSRKTMTPTQKEERIKAVSETFRNRRFPEPLRGWSERKTPKQTLVDGFMEIVNGLEGLTATEKTELQNQYRNLIYSKEKVDLHAFCNGQPFPYSILE